MRRFDQVPLAPTAPLRPAQIKRIRETSRVSQAVVAVPRSRVFVTARK